MAPTDPNPIPALRQLRTDLHADLLELIERIGAQLSPADLEALATDASVQAILARLDRPLTVDTGLTGLASEQTQAQVLQTLTGLTAVLGSTDGLEQIGAQQIALQTALNTYIQQVTGYTDGLEGLLGTLGTNTDGIETLLAQLGVKDDNVLGKLEANRVLLDAVRQLLTGTLSIGGTVAISNLPATQPVSGTVAVNNFPLGFTVSGMVAVSNFPATQPVSGTVNVGNFPATQPVSGTVGINNFPAGFLVSGAVSVTNFPGSFAVSNFPTTQAVSGTVNVGNFPATQPVSGAVNVNNFPATQPVSGSVNVGNFPATQQVGGSVNVGNFPATQATTRAAQAIVFDPGTFAAGASYSSSVFLNGRVLYAVQLGSVWTAANITLQRSSDGSTWFDVYDEFGNVLTLTAAASREIALTSGPLAGTAYIRLRSGTPTVTVAQPALVSFTLVSQVA